ncbi:hypothetical protein AQUCO_00100296v1 [Aquilegia coerulea]|uniref:Avr9/Cf-9 rapidly elicited protein 146 n=1 Tax=Aquilegia coerulea TaxID=218851 RepID=A0A2G5F9Y5_AQUCA|nr:hypothetical protein AQUCO_00100296v1 [Aquilegia coerulea]
MEPTNPPVMGKKLWHIVRIVFLMLRKKISKSKLLVDLHHMMSKRGKILEKVIGNLMFHNHSSFSCRSDDVQMSYIAPKEYEFSCSNSPAFPFHLNKRNKKHHHHGHNHHRNTHFFSPAHTTNDKAATVTAVQKILEMLNNEIIAEASPVAILPGFGRSPMVRQLRITDSPFPVRDVDENSSQVDKEAEEFIEKFYEQLRLQKMMSVREGRNQNGCPRSFG